MNYLRLCVCVPWAIHTVHIQPNAYRLCRHTVGDNLYPTWRTEPPPTGTGIQREEEVSGPRLAQMAGWEETKTPNTHTPGKKVKTPRNTKKKKQKSEKVCRSMGTINIKTLTRPLGLAREWIKCPRGKLASHKMRATDPFGSLPSAPDS